jgi:hypothetical protein
MGSGFEHSINKGQSRQSYVLAKTADDWKIARCQNARVDAEAAARTESPNYEKTF